MTVIQIVLHEPLNPIVTQIHVLEQINELAPVHIITNVSGFYLNPLVFHTLDSEGDNQTLICSVHVNRQT